MPVTTMRAVQLTALITAAGVAPGASAVGGEFDFGGYHVHVFADSDDTMGTPNYQIMVANDELTLTRLTAPYEGTLSNSFVADLDGDSNFEVVVTYADDRGHRTGLDVYTWQEYLLQPVRLADLSPAQTAGYRGEDQFAVSNGKLVRIFQIYAESGGEWQPTAAQRRLRYSFAESRWIDDP